MFSLSMSYLSKKPWTEILLFKENWARLVWVTWGYSQVPRLVVGDFLPPDLWGWGPGAVLGLSSWLSLSVLTFHHTYFAGSGLFWGHFLALRWGRRWCGKGWNGFYLLSSSTFLKGQSFELHRGIVGGSGFSFLGWEAAGLWTSVVVSVLA